MTKHLTKTLEHNKTCALGAREIETKVRKNLYSCSGYINDTRQPVVAKNPYLTGIFSILIMANN
jgi:hypothetical protein